MKYLLDENTMKHDEARDLVESKGLRPAEAARTLGLKERTVQDWAKKEDWKRKGSDAPSRRKQSSPKSHPLTVQAPQRQTDSRTQILALLSSPTQSSAQTRTNSNQNSKHSVENEHSETEYYTCTICNRQFEVGTQCDGLHGCQCFSCDHGRPIPGHARPLPDGNVQDNARAQQHKPWEL